MKVQKAGCLGCLGAIGLVVIIIVIVAIVSSIGNPKIDDVVGMTAKEAKSTLEKSGYENLSFKCGEVIGNIEDNWIVTKQTPSAGSKTDTKDEVTITCLSERTINLEKKLKATTAWAAVEVYGEKKYPYGFKVSLKDLKAQKALDEDTWFLKASCEVENASGNIATMTCSAKVKNIDGGPVVTSFSVR